MTQPNPSSPNPWPHRLAWLVALVTFPLIWVGGLVTTYEAGMAVPDWPSTYGYNLFRYPWQTWLFGPWDLFIEHGHRLLGATVGMLTIGLLFTLWRLDSRPAMRWIGVVALVGVILQGALGGMRVLFDERQLARLHGCFGPAFFALAAGIVVATSRRWQNPRAAEPTLAAGKVQRLAILTVALAYLQIVVGAFLRHQSLTAGPGAFRVVVLFHLLLAIGIAAHVVMLFLQTCRLPTPIPTLRRASSALVVLVGVQIVFGLMTWIENYGWPAGGESYALVGGHTIVAQGQLQSLVTTAHVATGSLILATAVVAALASLRWLARPTGSVRPVFESAGRDPLSRTLFATSLVGGLR